MPIYEFECSRCKLKFEVIQRMVEDHRADCPECGKPDAKRVYSMFSMNVATDAEISQRLHGVPKQRIEKAKELRNDRAKRKRDPSSEYDIVSNELHGPQKRKKKLITGGR